MKKSGSIAVFLFFLSVYLLFSNHRITTSMDVDVLRYASEYAATGTYGSEYKLSAGVSYSPKTGLFYPQEGVGIVVPLTLFVHLSDIFSPDSQFVLFTFNQIFSALAMLFVFLSLTVFMPARRAFLYSALFGFGTPLFVHSKYLLPEPVTLFTVTAAVYFLLRFRKDKKVLWLFLSGLFNGYALLTRPDAPIFSGLFILLALYTAYKVQRCLFVKNAVFFLFGFSIFTMVFMVSNHQRYGAFLETGYTLKRTEVIAALEKNMTETYPKAVMAHEADPESKETAMLVQQFQSQQEFYENITKLSSELGDKNTALSTNGAADFIRGIYLILFSPNRSIFFLSPFLLLIIAGAATFFKRFRVEFIIAGSILAGYLVLYALRAPLSYAGSAAWGIRYMLPVYPLIFISAVFFDRSFILKNPGPKKLFYILCVISIVFQVIGSGVNYQSVQMPVEHKSKQIYGTEDMTWAHKSRESMMTDFSSSLLLNNARIMLGSLTPEQEEYGVETGPNDWFFWQVIKGEGMLLREKEHLTGSFKLIFLLLLVSLGLSAYFIRNNFFIKDTGK
jgi:hypothetical protein